jgi:hypothetical protein
LGGRRRAADDLNVGKGGLGELGKDAGKSSRVDQVEPRKTRVRDKYQRSSMVVADTNLRSAGKCVKACSEEHGFGGDDSVLGNGSLQIIQETITTL